MMKTPISFVQPGIRSENKMTILSYFKRSYGQVRQQMEDGISSIQGGVSFIRDEFSHFYEHAGDRLNRMVSPVNNFLKDPSEIESALQQEINQLRGEPPAGNLIPIEIALQSPMEENY